MIFHITVKKASQICEQSQAKSLFTNLLPQLQTMKSVDKYREFTEIVQSMSSAIHEKNRLQTKTFKKAKT
jgi:hypothetical protein